MNKKLVKKNLVLRFKRILVIKALNGIATPKPLPEDLGEYKRMYYTSTNGKKKLGWFKKGDPNLILTKEVELNGFIMKPDGTKVSKSIRERNLKAPSFINNALKTKNWFGFNNKKLNPLEKLEVQIQNKEVQKVIPIIDWNSRFEIMKNGLSQSQLEYLDSLGIDLTSAETMLKGINAYNNSGLVVDNKWGKNSLNALEAILSKMPLGYRNPIPELEYIEPASQTFKSIGGLTTPYSWKLGLSKALSLSYYKNGGLISNNPVKRFKINFAILKTGGTILFYQYGGKSPEVEKLLNKLRAAGITKVMVNGREKELKVDGYMGPITKAAMQLYEKQKTGAFKETKVPYKSTPYLMDWEKLGKQKSKNEEIANGMGLILEDYGKLLRTNYENKLQIKASAHERANKNISNRYVSPDNTDKLLDSLWNIGAFNGLKDIHGRDIVYKTAVDGINGNVTKQAIKQAQSLGYIVDADKGTVTLKPNYSVAKISKEVNSLKDPSIIDNLKGFGKNILGRVFGDKDFITGKTEEELKKYDKLYNTQYSLEMDKGEPIMEPYDFYGLTEYRLKYDWDGRPIYNSKLGKLGLYDRKVDEEGNVCYKIKNDKGEEVTLCAETGNLITRALGVPTTGDAWTRHGVYGDSLIYGGTNHNKIYTRTLSKVVNGINPSDIDPNNLKSGDFVDLMRDTNIGKRTDKLATSGRGNTHTGTIYKPYGDKGPAYIIHNIGGDVFVDPLAKFGPVRKWSIMGVRRPGSKENPYLKEH